MSGQHEADSIRLQSRSLSAKWAAGGGGITLLALRSLFVDCERLDFRVKVCALSDGYKIVKCWDDDLLGGSVEQGPMSFWSGEEH